MDEVSSSPPKKSEESSLQLFVKGLFFLKDKILECFRKGLNLERGESC